MGRLSISLLVKSEGGKARLRSWKDVNKDDIRTVDVAAYCWDGERSIEDKSMVPEDRVYTYYSHMVSCNNCKQIGITQTKPSSER